MRRGWIVAVVLVALVAGGALLAVNLSGRAVETVPARPAGTGEVEEAADAEESDDISCENDEEECLPLDLPIDEPVPFEETPDDPDTFWEDPEYDDPEETVACPDTPLPLRCFELIELIP